MSPTDEEVERALAAFRAEERRHTFPTNASDRSCMRAALTAAWNQRTPTVPMGDVEREIAACIDMIENCADVPRNLDSLPMMLLDRLREIASALSRTSGWRSIEWLVWSNEHRAWWRPNAAGYTKKIVEAGRYSFDDALKHCQGWHYRSGTNASGVEWPPETMVPAPPKPSET